VKWDWAKWGRTIIINPNVSLRSPGGCHGSAVGAVKFILYYAEAKYKICKYKIDQKTWWHCHVFRVAGLIGMQRARLCLTSVCSCDDGFVVYGTIQPSSAIA